MNKILLFTVTLALFSCGRIYNSSTPDKAAYSPRSAGTPQYEAAQAIIVAKCSECHGQWNGYSERDYISNNLIVAQDPTNSSVYFRNQLGPGPQNNMPTQGRPAMTADELQTISDWINSATP